jgi:hypothetical protein
MTRALATVVLVLACVACGGSEEPVKAVTTVATPELLDEGAFRVCTGARTDVLERELAREIASRLALDLVFDDGGRPVDAVADARCDAAFDRVRVTDAIQAHISIIPYVEIDLGARGHLRYGIVLPKGRDSLYFGVRGALSSLNEDGTTRRLFDEAGLRNAHILGMA